MSNGITRLQSDVTKNLKAKLQRVNSLQAFVSMRLTQVYENLQRKRWITENSSEAGTKWTALSKSYRAYKLKKWHDAPGGGRHILVASGNLQKCMITPGFYKKIATNTKLTISTDVEYAPYVNETRNFTEWSAKSIADFRKRYKDFVFKNKLVPI